MFENTFNFMTYEAQNIFIYFILIPLLWSITLDYKFNTKIITPICVFLILLTMYLHDYLFYFNKLVSFCQYFSKYGYNYTKTCIVFCILYPMVVSIIITLIPKQQKNEKKNIEYNI